MKPAHRYPGPLDRLQSATESEVISGQETHQTEPAREELRQLAEDIVKYCPNLAQMLIAIRSCPPYIGLN